MTNSQSSDIFLHVQGNYFRWRPFQEQPADKLNRSRWKYYPRRPAYHFIYSHEPRDLSPACRGIDEFARVRLYRVQPKPVAFWICTSEKPIYESEFNGWFSFSQSSEIFHWKNPSLKDAKINGIYLNQARRREWVQIDSPTKCVGSVYRQRTMLHSTLVTNKCL